MSCSWRFGSATQTHILSYQFMAFVGIFWLILAQINLLFRIL